ncbi:MAG: gamma-glutamylcyclotransferase family protein [Chitinophagaceae bacterium]
MTNETCYLFAYGTLRKGFSSPIYKSIVEEIEWMGFSRVKGKLFDIGEYPGAIRSESENYIVGEIIKIKTSVKVLEILDDYECCYTSTEKRSEYERKKEWFVLKNGIRVEAWIYWYNLPVNNKQQIPGNDYLNYLQIKQ